MLGPRFIEACIQFLEVPDGSRYKALRMLRVLGGGTGLLDLQQGAGQFGTHVLKVVHAPGRFPELLGNAGRTIMSKGSPERS